MTFYKNLEAAKKLTVSNSGLLCTILFNKKNDIKKTLEVKIFCLMFIFILYSFLFVILYLYYKKLF